MLDLVFLNRFDLKKKKKRKKRKEKQVLPKCNCASSPTELTLIL